MWLSKISFNADGLIPTIAQDWQTGTVLMMAWMNAESLQLTVETKQATYWSRSRNKLWRKGEESGHTQHVKDILLDCDGDTLLLKVEQIGGIACHTMRENCFFNRLIDDNTDPGDKQWQIIAEPKKVFSHSNSFKSE
jgi:phosphoribosyl-AMP cyclohydrolase